MKKFAELILSNRAKLIINIYSQWLTKGDKVLDVGCGDGIITESLSKHYNLKISGCDIEKYLIKNMPFSKMTSEEKIPFPNDSFDTLMFNDVLHHTSKTNQEKLIIEALRIVKNNILIFELKKSPLNYIADFIINKIYHPSMKTPCTFRTEDEWNNLFHILRVKVTIKDIPRPQFSPFNHIAYCLAKLQ